MPKYITKQRKKLLLYLSEHLDEQLTAKQIASALAHDDISLSAVYRNLSDLETEGKVKRYSRSGAREVFYQYTDIDPCRGKLHLSCMKCGKTFHMNANGAEQIIKQIAKDERFTISIGDSVLYGVCEKCNL